MLGWLWRLIVGRFRALPPAPVAPPCTHHWDLFQQVECKDGYFNEVYGRIYVLRCKDCGDIAQRKVVA